ncbi:MAG: hypothetical protein ACYSW8_24065 [Planctomycetota bacterium]|jgi:hypothetical protein
MANGDEKYRSRKWRLAKASLIIVTVFAAFGMAGLIFKGEVTAAGIALIMGAWAGSDTTILGLYAHYNVKEKAG